jgi:membrane-associated phospholipid phosphatase
LGVLRRASIHANTFPSAHVAASLAAALAVLRHQPGAGVVFLWIAASIAAGAVLRRYHFALDVVAGAFVAFASLALSAR